MTSFDFGAIVLLKFPYTDLQGSAKRPALVVYDEGDEDVVVARITSQPYTGKHDYEIANWRKMGLFFPSWIRLGEISNARKENYRARFEQIIKARLRENKSNSARNVRRMVQ